jgi:hypothetical protein
MRLKATSFAVRASRNQAARWGWWATRAGFRSVGAWLERLADAEVERRERARGVYDPPPPSRLP